MEKFISRMCRCKCRTHSSWMERGPWNSTSQNLRGATERSSQRCEKRQRHSFACSPGHPLLSLSTPTLEGSHMCVSTHTPSRYSGRWWVLPEGHVTCHDTSTPMEGCELADPAHGSRVGLRSRSHGSRVPHFLSLGHTGHLGKNCIVKDLYFASSDLLREAYCTLRHGCPCFMTVSCVGKLRHGAASWAWNPDLAGWKSRESASGAEALVCCEQPLGWGPPHPGGQGHGPAGGAGSSPPVTGG